MNSKLHLTLAALLASTCIAPSAVAQVESDDPFPVRDFIDENGVDLMTGEFTAQSPAVLIGDRTSGISWFRNIRGDEAQDNLFGRINFGSSVAIVAFGGRSEIFSRSGSIFTPRESRGSTLVYNSSADTFDYTIQNGTVISFEGSSLNRLKKVRQADGKELTFHYYQLKTRPRSVTSNTGYHIKLTYDFSGYLYKVMGFNDLVDSCSTTASSCTASGDRPSVTISWNGSSNTRSYTDSLGRETKFIHDADDRIVGIRYPGSSSNNVSITYSGGSVSSITAGGVTTTYGYSTSGSIRTTTVTRGSLPQRAYTFDLSILQMTSAQDEFDRDRTYSYDTSARLTGVDRDGGVDVTYAYDSRGNVTSVTRDPPDSATNIVTSATYASSCGTPDPACNKPLTTTDPRGKVTDYTYDGTHGGVLTVTAPAPSTGAARPQTRFTYAELDSSGTPSSTGVYRLTESSSCLTQAGSSGSTPAACLGTADEVKTVISYGDNILPETTSTGAGNDSSPPVTTSSYDPVGNLLTGDGPLAGTADTVRYRYDAGRQLVGSISADPDGAGTLQPRATKTTYNGWGQATKVETGNVPSQLDGDWSSFAAAEIVDITYDAHGRKTKQTLSTKTGSMTTLQTAVQYSYTADGLPECVAQRMNTAVFGSLPSSACTLGTEGFYGPDRITKTIYDSLGRVSKIQTGFGTAMVRDEVMKAYLAGNLLGSLTDAEGNKTTYSYDSFDRLWKTNFPSKIKGAGSSSSTDYEQLTYDAGSNVTAKRLRDGTTINYTYDNLSRLTTMNLPGSDPDVTYAYNNLGWMSSASQTGHGLSYTYDALGRRLSEAGPLGTVSYAYDAAGRRTSMTYPGSGLAVHYEHLVTGELTKIRENGTSGLALATYGYDGRGRLTSVTRGNGTTTSYGYDAMSRLTQLVQDLEGSGTSKDLTLGFTYTPASQILTNTRSNDLYAWTDHVTVARDYANNGLNQATQAASSGATVDFTYDDRGNLTQSSPVGATATSYTYDSLNRLVSASGTSCSTCSGTASLAYDPSGRLYQTAGSATTRLAYDGVDLIAEYDGSSSLLRRYVHGPGMDAPLVWYEGSGTSTRKYLHADERGSIIAGTNDSGTSTFTSTYDEYGIPGSTNQGRFQYTGQGWLPELGLYYYKARLYSPTLGRFLQTDPVGYGDGMNMYGYVGGDPVNFQDTTGLGRTDGCEDDVTVCGPRRPRGVGVMPVPAVIVEQPNNSKDDVIVINGRRRPRPASQSSTVCRIPRGRGNLHFQAKIVSPPAGPSYITGTLTDPSTGASASFHQIGLGGITGVGVISLSGTITGGFGALSKGLDIGGFVISAGLDVKGGIGGYGVGSATLTTYGGDLIGQVDASVAGVTPGVKIGDAGVGAATFVFDFSPVAIEMTSC